MQLDRLGLIGAFGAVAGLQGAAEGKQNATGVERAVALKQETDNLCEGDIADRTVLPGDSSGLAVENINGDARWVHFSEPSYFSSDLPLDSLAPFPSQRSYPPSSENSHNPHWTLNAEVLALTLGENTPTSCHQYPHHMENTVTTESSE